MVNDPKDTIYIDVDDDITTIINKLQSSPKKIVALVLPKRAAVFQSIVNMKLLKRTADNTKKHVVLITSEAALLPLAGAVGVRVAKTLQSKPFIPDPPNLDSQSSAEEVEKLDPDDKPLDPNTPVGELAGLENNDSAIEIDNSPKEADKPKEKPAKNAKKANKKIKIPNFDKFRTKAMLGVLVFVALIGLWFVAFRVLPKATVTLKTDTSNISTNFDFTADLNASSLDEENLILPAIKKEFRNTDTEKVAATGEKDKGTKASGVITLSVDCADGPVTVPSGTGVSTGNLTFITKNDTTIASFPDTSNGCQFHRDVDVVAQNAGEQYNLSAGKSFSVSGFSSVSATNPAATSGGTSNIVKVVRQEDIDKAKDAIAERAGDEAPGELKEDIQKAGHMALEATLVAGDPTVSSTSKVGDEASDVTVTSTTVYTMLGVKEEDLAKLIEATAKQEIDESRQVIVDNGLSEATMQTESQNGNQAVISLQTIVVAGPDLDIESISQEIAGKKRGESQDLIKARPGIKDVEIAYSPFWVQSNPSNPKKIDVVFESDEDQENNESEER